MESSGINLVELKPGPSYVLSELKLLLVKESSKFVKKVYDFDINKADQIYDILLKDKQLILSDDHKVPSLEQMRGKK